LFQERLFAFLSGINGTLIRGYPCFLSASCVSTKSTICWTNVPWD